MPIAKARLGMHPYQLAKPYRLYVESLARGYAPRPRHCGAPALQLRSRSRTRGRAFARRGRSVCGTVSLTAATVSSARPACLSNVESALMSHHFDTPTAREDPRINVCDFYLFRGRPGFTVMAMTVNPDAGRSPPDTFRDEGLYAFRFDLNGDVREELSFKVRFGAVLHADEHDGAHVQSFEVRRASGSAASMGAHGDLIVAGHTGRVVETATGVKAFAGLAPDLFAGDAMALGEFRTALFEKERFDPGAFQSRKNFCANRNVTALVLRRPLP
jgi:Domain of unknown function (DUF4331)